MLIAAYLIPEIGNRICVYLELGLNLVRAFCKTRVPLQPGQSFKFTVLETLDRIKEEFQFLQAQYHSLKIECEKLASEKTEMQRHYIMVSPHIVETEKQRSQAQTCK
uniref:Groucho/TLE N-terminal Q-rich domain-containing protein n=1 Tax=Sinocyclocheilus anshuiensis TaxID=1608454 RepID=A0A671SBT8_9TELE